MAIKKPTPKKKVPALKKMVKPVRSHVRIQTAEGWKRFIVKKLGKKRLGKSLL